MIFAHQGGWDEFLLVIGPLLVIAWLVSVAKKRANRVPDSTEPIEQPKP